VTFHAGDGFDDDLPRVLGCRILVSSVVLESFAKSALTGSSRAVRHRSPDGVGRRRTSLRKLSILTTRDRERPCEHQAEHRDRPGSCKRLYRLGRFKYASSKNSFRDGVAHRGYAPQMRMHEGDQNVAVLPEVWSTCTFSSLQHSFLMSPWRSGHVNLLMSSIATVELGPTRSASESDSVDVENRHGQRNNCQRGCREYAVSLACHILFDCLRRIARRSRCPNRSLVVVEPLRLNGVLYPVRFLRMARREHGDRPVGHSPSVSARRALRSQIILSARPTKRRRSSRPTRASAYARANGCSGSVNDDVGWEAHGTVRELERDLGARSRTGSQSLKLAVSALLADIQ